MPTDTFCMRSLSSRKARSRRLRASKKCCASTVASASSTTTAGVTSGALQRLARVQTKSKRATSRVFERAWHHADFCALTTGARPLGALLWHRAGALASGAQTAWHHRLRRSQRINRRFGVEPLQNESAFIPLVGIDLDMLASVHHTRKVSNDNTVSFKTLCLQLPKFQDRAHLVR